MLLARMFAYADAHRYRIGSNFHEVPVNQAKAADVHSYTRDGHLRQTIHPHTDPVYAPNSKGGPVADPAKAGDERGWESDSEMVRAAATLHADDNDFGQAGTLVRNVFTDEQRARFVVTLTGQYEGIKDEGIKARFLEYWTNVDADVAQKIQQAV
jgi:catalase